MCRVAQLERLTFKQQLSIFAESQIIVMTHGAALGNVMFMSPVSLPVQVFLPTRDCMSYLLCIHFHQCSVLISDLIIRSGNAAEPVPRTYCRLSLYKVLWSDSRTHITLCITEAVVCLPPGALPEIHGKCCRQADYQHTAVNCWCALQGSVAVFYNWLKIEHTWVTDLIKDYAVPVSYVGLSTKDRRFIYPQKEVMHGSFMSW